jgi:hypothetical protein
VVDVAAIGAKDGLMAEETADDGESGIEEGNGEGQKGGGHAEDGGGFLTPEQPIAPRRNPLRRLPQSPRKTVAGLKFYRRKPRRAAASGGGGEGQRNIVLEQGRHQSGESGEESGAGGQTIDAIDEVERIGAAYWPKDGGGPPHEYSHLGQSWARETE